jgi:threonine dehydrogenase-like Zn-dependent dehydrogenase
MQVRQIDAAHFAADVRDFIACLAEEGVIVQFGVPPHRADLVNRIDGVSFDEAWAGRVRVHLVGGSRRITVHYIGAEALIANKRAVGRHKDLEDLRYLSARSRRRRG